MATKKVVTMGDPVQIADKIYKISVEIAAYEDGLKPLKDKRDRLKEEMLGVLRGAGIKQFGTDTGVVYSRAFRSSLTVSDPDKALKWALGNECARVDTVKASKVLKGAGAVPEGFDYKETEYLSSKGLSGALED